MLVLGIILSLAAIPAKADDGGSVFSIVLEKLSSIRMDRSPASRPTVILSGIGFIPGAPQGGVPINLTTAPAENSPSNYTLEYCAELARLQSTKKHPDHWKLEIRGRGAFTLREGAGSSSLTQENLLADSRYDAHLSVDSCRLVESGPF